VIRHLVHAGIELPRHRLTDEQAQMVAELYVEGLTLIEEQETEKASPECSPRHRAVRNAQGDHTALVLLNHSDIVDPSVTQLLERSHGGQRPVGSLGIVKFQYHEIRHRSLLDRSENNREIAQTQQASTCITAPRERQIN